MTTLDLMVLPPNMADGVPLGMPQYPGFRFFVQIAVASSGSILPFVLPGTLGAPTWFDVTADLAGVDWERGGSAGGRPMAGEVRFRLNNVDCKWSAWQNPYYGPGTLMRMVIYGGGIPFYYLFAGVIQSWEDGGEGQLAYEWIDVVAWEPQFLWNEVNDNALLTSVGAGENLNGRINRLANKVDYQFGYGVPSTSPATFQGTDLAQDMATELYLTVDSADCVAWCGRRGQMLIADRAVGNGVAWEIQQNDINPDTLKTANDDVRILAQVALARVGGSEVVFTNVGVAARYYRRSTKRDGLVTVAEAADADLVRVANGILGRSNQTYRPRSLEMESGQNLYAQRMLVEAEITDRVTVRSLAGDGSRLVFFSYALCKTSISVMVKDGGTYWSGTFELDIEVDSHWSHFRPIWVWGVSFWGSATEGWGP